MAKEKEQKAAPAPVNIVAHRALTYKHWKESAGLRQQLRTVLDSNIFQLARATLLEQAMPNAPVASQLDPGISAEARALEYNNRYHNRSGFHQFARALENLAKEEPAKAEVKELVPEDE
jgi:hypothetical protein